MSVQSSNTDAKELQQQDDDAVLCAFGPEYFNGARYGSGIGSLLSFLFAWRAYRETRNARIAYLLHSGTRQGNLPKMKFFATMRYGFRMQPLYSTGVMACTATGMAKLLKFYLASGRVNEFLLDDFEFGELRSWAAESPDTSKAFNDFCLDSLESSLKPSVAVATSVNSSLTLTDKLIVQHGNAKRQAGFGDQAIRRRPTFGDGVAVGLLGSIMDCYLPTKPQSMYFDWRFGVL